MALLSGKESDDERKAREDAEYIENKKAKKNEKKSKKESKKGNTTKENGEELYKSLNDIRETLKSLNELNEELDKKEQELEEIKKKKSNYNKDDKFYKKYDKEEKAKQTQVDELHNKKEELNTEYTKNVQKYNEAQNMKSVDINEYNRLNEYHAELKKHLEELRAALEDANTQVHNAKYYLKQTKASHSRLQKLNPFWDKYERAEYNIEKKENQSTVDSEKLNKANIEKEINETSNEITKTWKKISQMKANIDESNRRAQVAVKADDSRKRIEGNDPSKKSQEPPETNEKKPEGEEKKPEEKKDDSNISDEDEGLISKAINAIRGAVNKVIQWINGLYKRFREIVLGKDEAESTATESAEYNSDLDYLDSVIFGESFIDNNEGLNCIEEPHTDNFYETLDAIIETL